MPDRDALTPQRRQHVERLVAEAMTRPAGEREAFLCSACSGDGELLDAVRTWLSDRSAPPAAERPTPVTVPVDYASMLDGASTTPGGVGGAAVPFLEGYEIVREIGRGGQGVVYEATQQHPRRRVAIKVLLDSHTGSKAAKKRFDREIDLIAQLRHPNVISIFHSGATADGRHYYVMDFVEGLPLDRFVRARQLALEEVLRLFVVICDAVQHAHQKGVLHRDLKPSNVIVDAAGVPHILDFGLAKPLGGAAGTMVSITREIVGTLPFMSPEQASSAPGDVDTRTDVYALGVMLYFVLTGQFPFDAERQISKVLHDIAEAPPRPMTKAWSPGAGISRRLQRRWGAEVCPIDRELELIVGKALAKERERRYQSAGELARDIERYLAGEALEARRDSLAYVLWKQSRRLLRQAPAVALAIVCAVLMPGLIASLAFWRSAVRERDIAQTTIAFLNHDVFQALDPEAMGRGVDLRDLLDAASKQIDERFGDAPSAEASIRQSVGSLYASLGENDKARQHLERALALQRAEYGNDHLSVAETLQALAPVLEIQGQVAEAERCLDEALAIRRHRLGENHPQVATTLAQVAAFATRRGDLERAASLGGTPAPSPPSARPAGENAVELAEQRLRDARQTYEEGHPQIAQQLVELAEALLAAGDRSQAADRLLQVLDIHTRQFGSEHPRTRATFARVERLLEQIDGLERLLPALTARLASARESNNNARLLADAAWDVVKFPGYPAEQYEEARAAAERAAALRPSDGSYLNTLGVAQYRTGRFAEAVATLQKSDELNSGHPADVAFLAMALHRADQPDAAREQLTRLEKVAAEVPWSTDAQTQRFLAEARAALGVS